VAARNRRSFPIVKVGAAGFPLYSPPTQGDRADFRRDYRSIGAAIAAVLAPLSILSMAESDDRCLGGRTVVSGKCTRIADATARPRRIARRRRVSVSCHRKGPASRRARGNRGRPKPPTRCSASAYPQVAPSSQRCWKRSEINCLAGVVAQSREN
jgi:hypothetical protein